MTLYHDRLRAELDALRARRVNLRRTIDFYAAGRTFGGDALDASCAQQRATLELRSTEYRWGELHHLLGREPPGPPVKLIPGAAQRISSVPRRRVPGR